MLNTCVTRIQWGDTKEGGSQAPIVVECAGGEVIEADYVIVTVSLGVLKVGVGRESRVPSVDF